MKFVKLHKGGVEVLVNMSTVSEVYHAGDNENMSKLYFNFADGDDMQASIIADESLDEIYEKVNGSEEVYDALQRHLLDLLEMKHNQEPDRSIEAPELQYVRESYNPPFEKGSSAAKAAYWSVEKEHSK